MCGGGSSASDKALIARQNAIQQRNFDAQLAQSRRQFEANALFNRESLEFQKANAEAQLALQHGEIARQIANEEEREARIQGAVSDIDTAFQGRDVIHDKLAADTFALNKDALLENKGDSERNLAFALTRAGRRFDSLERDKSSDINDRHTAGLLDAKLYSDGVANQSRSADASLRQALLGSAASGVFNGQDLVNSATGSLNAIANTKGGVSGELGDISYFSDIPASINQLSGFFGDQQAYAGGGGFRPGQSSKSSAGKVSNLGV